MSNLGRNISGNPRAIYEKLVELGLDKKYRCYYILNEPQRYRGTLPGNVKLIKNARMYFYYVMATSGVWVSDTRFQNYIIKRKNVRYIQTWHGTPLKKLALDMESLHMAGDESLDEYKELFRDNAKTWDYLISQNPFSTETFRRAFDFKGKMLEIGYPRNDKLFEPREEVWYWSLKKKLGFPTDKKVILYAPTWRDDNFYNKEDYRFPEAMDYEAMRMAFGEEYILVAKFHYMVREKKGWNRWEDFVYPISDACDISELYCLADVLITDYSSVMFDYSLLKKPMYFYAYDLEKYRDELRGFYFDFEKEAPGVISTDTDHLIRAIRSNEWESEEIQMRYRAFCEKYNPFDDGNASQKVIELIEKP